MEINKIYQGDSLQILKTFESESVDCVITSPPYWGLRDYQVDGQLGLEKQPEEYINKLVNIFTEVKRVLKKTGTFWLNLGDTYAGSGNGSWNTDKPEHWGKQFWKKKKPNEYLAPPRKEYKKLCSKNILGIPWKVVFALQDDGWILRQDIIWHKPNVMPESVKDRCTKSHEYIFFLTKNKKYFYNYQAILEPAQYDGRKDTKFKGGIKYKEADFMPDGYKEQSFQVRGHERWPNKIFDKNGIPARNKRSVWVVNTKPFKDAHFAVFPEELIEPMVKGGSPENGIVLDPFMGSGTVGVVAKKLNRNFMGIELNPDYIKIAERRINLIQKQLSINGISDMPLMASPHAPGLHFGSQRMVR